jgi:short-subunit dehydrogenase
MQTALVTGATAGIGLAFSRHLASLGCGLVLVARDPTRLSEARANVLSLGAPAVEVIAADLTDPAQRDAVVRRLQVSDTPHGGGSDARPPVDLLVNNAGKGVGKSFVTATTAELLDQLELNVTAVMLLTHAALPGMRQRAHGAIINVASMAAWLPGRGSTYSASKSWVVSFSEGLAMSLRGTGVRIQALCPSFVRTEFHQRAGIDMTGRSASMYIDADDLVRASMADLRRNSVISIPGARFRATALATRILPRPLVRSVVYRMDKDTRT